MSKIRSKNTKAELVVFKELRKRKIYFQKHYKKVVGCPDVAFPKQGWKVLRIWESEAKKITTQKLSKWKLY